MPKIRTLYKLMKNPEKFIRVLGEKGVFNWLSDEQYLKLIYRAETGKKLDLENPKSFNEKLQWLKLYDRNPEYVKLVDKYEVRKYIAEKIGEEYLIPLIGVYNSVDEIDWNNLPQKFVLKCTHGSGCNIICKDKSELNINLAKKKLNKWMKKNWYWFGREWPYKYIKPRIICEKYMVDESGKELKDYKIFCFNGEPKVIQVDYNRFINHKRNLYDLEWNYMPLSIKYPNDPNKIINKPQRLGEMLNIARILSKDYPHVRVDFYSINEKIYFGELTFYHGSGFEKFEPESYNYVFGSWLQLP